MKQYTKKKETL